MAITTYSDLISTLKGYMAKSGLDAECKNGVSIFESIYNAGEKSYFQEALATVITVAGSATVDLPSDYNGLVSLAPRDRRFTITPTTVQYIQQNPVASQGVPSHYAVYPGNKLIFNAVPDAAYTYDLVYQQKLIPLSDTNQTNWMLARWPHIYLYGTLLEMLEFTHNGVRADRIQGKMNGFMAEIQAKAASNKLASNFAMQTKAGLP